MKEEESDHPEEKDRSPFLFYSSKVPLLPTEGYLRVPGMTPASSSRTVSTQSSKSSSHPTSIPVPTGVLTTQVKRKQARGELASPLTCTQVCTCITGASPEGRDSASRISVSTPRPVTAQYGEVTYYKTMCAGKNSTTATAREIGRASDSHPPAAGHAEFSIKMYSTHATMSSPADSPTGKRGSRPVPSNKPRFLRLRLNSAASNSPHSVQTTPPSYIAAQPSPPKDMTGRHCMSGSPTHAPSQASSKSPSPIHGQKLADTPTPRMGKAFFARPVSVSVTPVRVPGTPVNFPPATKPKEKEVESPRFQATKTMTHAASQFAKADKKRTVIMRKPTVAADSVESALNEKMKKEMLMGRKQGSGGEATSLAEKRRVWKGENGVFRKDLLRSWYRHMGSDS